MLRNQQIPALCNYYYLTLITSSKLNLYRSSRQSSNNQHLHITPMATAAADSSP
jgi:hypothetical protein